MPDTVLSLNEILDQSSATADFKNAVQSLANGQTSNIIQYNPGVPPVKALRAISKLLESEPKFAVQSVLINATSGCSDFVGTISVNGGEAEFSFIWDCSWRAKQEKYTDHFGYPDQIRAAREFQYQCFKKFERTV